MAHHNERSKIVAGLLALFFGSFGAHKFYLKDTGTGFMYIMLFVMTASFRWPISGILGIIDAFRIFSMSEQSFDKRYNQRGVRRYRTKYNRNREENSRQEPRREPLRETRKAPTRVEKPKERKKANPFIKRARQHFKEFEIEEAIENFEKAIEINGTDKTIYFELARAYSLDEKPAKSLDALNKSIKLGFTDFDKILSDDALSFLRIQPAFESFRENKFSISKSASTGKEKSTKSENLLEDDILLSQLNKLAELRKRGLLSEDEFVLERKKLLKR